MNSPNDTVQAGFVDKRKKTFIYKYLGHEGGESLQKEVGGIRWGNWVEVSGLQISSAFAESRRATWAFLLQRLGTIAWYMVTPVGLFSGHSGGRNIGVRDSLVCA